MLHLDKELQHKTRAYGDRREKPFPSSATQLACNKITSVRTSNPNIIVPTLCPKDYSDHLNLFNAYDSFILKKLSTSYNIKCTFVPVNAKGRYGSLNTLTKKVIRARFQKSSFAREITFKQTNENGL